MVVKMTFTWKLLSRVFGLQGQILAGTLKLGWDFTFHYRRLMLDLKRKGVPLDLCVADCVLSRLFS